VIATAYIRVSSRTQDHGMQRAAIERAAAARGDTIGAWYAEKRSGKTITRPELDRLRADARAGSVRRVYVFRLDRLTRSGIRDTLEVVEGFRGHGWARHGSAHLVDARGQGRVHVDDGVENAGGHGLAPRPNRGRGARLSPARAAGLLRDTQPVKTQIKSRSHFSE